MANQPVSREEFDELRRNFNELMDSSASLAKSTLEGMKVIHARIESLEAWRKFLTTPKDPPFPITKR